MILRLFFAAIISFVTAVIVGMMAATPLVVWLRDGLHAGCDRTWIDGEATWSCPDGIGYIAPIVLLVMVTALALMLIVIRFWRGLGEREERISAGIVISRYGAAATMLFGVAVAYIGLVEPANGDPRDQIAAGGALVSC